MFYDPNTDYSDIICRFDVPESGVKLVVYIVLRILDVDADSVLTMEEFFGCVIDWSKEPC